MIGEAAKTAQEIRSQLARDGLSYRSVQVVVCDQGLRIDVRTDAFQKVRDALPLKVRGVAVIVVP